MFSVGDVGLELVEGSSGTSLNRLGLYSSGMSSVVDGTGTSPSTRLIFRDFLTSFIFSSAARSFVVGGTGRTGPGDFGGSESRRGMWLLASVELERIDAV